MAGTGVQASVRPQSELEVGIALMAPVRLFGMSFVAITAYLLLGMLVTLQALRPWDVVLLQAVQQLTHPVWDAAFAVVAIVGSSEVTVTIAVLLASVLWLRGHRALACVLLAYLVMYPFELAGKLFLPQEPPGPDLLRQAYRYPLTHVDLGHSFPSGHAGRFAFFAIVAWWGARYTPSSIRTGARATLIGLILPVLASRIYIGAHWPSDVIGGVLLGTALACAALGWYLSPNLRRVTNNG